jgi:hypothetical protein
MEQTMSENSNPQRPSLRDLFPDVSEEELKAVENTLHGYLEIAWRIYERLEQEHPGVFDRSERPS